MKTKNLILSLLVLLIGVQIQGQTRADRRMTFNQGEMFVLYEEYNEALPLYLELLELYPDNFHFKYRIGQCYLNIPGEKEKAIPYLEDAVRNISARHKPGRFNEKNAPFDALYYLANAYRVDNQLKLAIDTYGRFLENMDHKVYDSTVVRFQLETCHNALQMMSTPLYVRKSNLGEDINDRYSETNPVVTADEDKMFFTRVLPFRRALFFSKFEDGSWSGPVDIITDLNVDDKFYPTSVSGDGKTLYLYSDYDFIGNIYVSRFVNGRWTPVEKLNENINTKYWESHASISPDGRKLFFASNRKGGYGGLDIYVSELDTTGNWGVAKNLGPIINTPYHEDTPHLTEDGNTLFFSSRGHYNMGGYDIFYTTMLDSGKWSVPLNAGYPLNTTDDDLFFMPVRKGYQGYIARFDEKGYGRQDIYRVEIFSDDHPRKFLIRGITRIQDLRPDIAESIRIIVRDVNDPNMVVVVYSDPETGKYEFEVKHGDYEITIDADGAVRNVKRLTLALDHPGDTLAIGVTELEKTDFEAELRVLTDSVLKVGSDKQVEIPLYTEPNSVLDIVVVNEGKVLYSERVSISDTSYVYRFMPQPGKNLVEFRLTDKFSNVTTARVVVERGVPRRETITRPEYARIVADRQVASFLDILKKNADDDLARVISTIDPAKKKFAGIDEVLSHIKELASAKGIEPERVDKLALKTAVNNNILTQAAVDYLGRNATGELRDILHAIDISDSKLRSWSDLKEYVSLTSQGRLGGDDLDRLANYLLTGADPVIAVLREKIGHYAPITDRNQEITEALAETDKKYITNAGEWLGSFHSFALEKGLTDEELATLYATIGFPPDTGPAVSLSQLLKHASGNVAEYLGNMDLKKLKIKTSNELVYHLIKSQGEFDSGEFFGALASVIAENNLTAATIKAPRPAKGGLASYIFIVLAGLGILFLLIFFIRRKRKEGKR